MVVAVVELKQLADAYTEEDQCLGMKQDPHRPMAGQCVDGNSSVNGASMNHSECGLPNRCEDLAGPAATKPLPDGPQLVTICGSSFKLEDIQAVQSGRGGTQMAPRLRPYQPLAQRHTPPYNPNYPGTL